MLLFEIFKHLFFSTNAYLYKILSPKPQQQQQQIIGNSSEHEKS